MSNFNIDRIRQLSGEINLSLSKKGIVGNYGNRRVKSSEMRLRG
ncbi:MAG: hypothetical protein QME49_06610 [bacterium]|nr:hypothetical protein [bacterium]